MTQTIETRAGTARRGHSLKALMLSSAVIPALLAQSALAQDNASQPDEIIVTGIRQSLESALNEKQSSDNIVEVIQAEDIGKLPDQNLAEVLENITGVQITRTAGIGSAVQIRGTGANRVEINGVSTVGDGAGRSGISFQDLPAAIIGSVEVIKVPTAKTIEGSVGGTINLRTLRALDLNEPIAAFRAQGEYTDLADTIQPRVSGTLGNNWETDAGEFGVVVSGSYFRQDVSAFLPRFDRDREVLPDSGRDSAEDFPFLRTQFFNQDNDNFEFETLNLTGSVEWAPTDEFKFYADATINDQERRQESTQVQFSGTGGSPVVDNTTNTSFETINLGSIDGPNGTLELGSVQAVLTGILEPGQNETGNLDPNLRTRSDTGARVTDSRVFALGGEWEKLRTKILVEASLSTSDSETPNFSTTLDFINPNSSQPSLGGSLDNGVPIEFDARDGTLQFGLAQGLDSTPTSAQLFDPANYALRQVQQSDNLQENQEAAFRADVSYDTTDILPFITSFDVGYRWNKNDSLNDDAVRNVNLTNATNFFNRPTADLFSEFVVEGPDNFDRADDRRLFVDEFLIIDPEASFDDPEAVLAAINGAIATRNLLNDGMEDTLGQDIAPLTRPTQSVGAFFDIQETTHALYAQANFDATDAGLPLRGVAGLRYVQTEQESTGFNVIDDGEIVTVQAGAEYDFLLPRLSLVLEPREDLLIRGGISRDLRRPNFNDLSTSIVFGGGANGVVQAGNPSLQPETVWSYDVSAEWYFSPASILAVGFFHKDRTNLIENDIDFPLDPEGPDGQIARDITAPCEDGGIFNPLADRNVFSPIQGNGICVPFGSRFNVDGSTTQTGIEASLQYDLSEWEDRLGWASGFGFIGNFTYQEQGGTNDTVFNADGDGNALNDILGRTDDDQSTPTLDDDVVQFGSRLLNLSNYSFNTTVFYDKFGLNFRARYTWRSDFIIGNRVSFNIPDIVDDRGQLNANINYDVTDNVNVSLEGINLLREDQNRFCVNDDALLCFQGLSDRRIIAGLNVSF